MFFLGIKKNCRIVLHVKARKLEPKGDHKLVKAGGRAAEDRKGRSAGTGGPGWVKRT